MSNGRIPDEAVDAVLKHHDIVDVVGKYVHLSKQGHYLKGLCPFHSEKTPSFTVTPEKQIFYCYGCHAGGNAIQFMMRIEGFTFGEAVRQMAEDANIPIGWEPQAAEQTQGQKEIAELVEAYQLSARWYHAILKTTTQGKPAMEYLRKRGFSDRMIDFFQIGYAPHMWDKLTQALAKKQFDLPLMEKGGLLTGRSGGEGYNDKFRDRVIFPICDRKGRVIAFGGRAMGDVQPKYLNSPETVLFNKSRSLFNLHNARAAIRKSLEVVLFEGYVDVIKAWEAGIENGVATMGTALTEQHAEMIRRQAERVIVCYDGDDAGQAAAYKSIAILEKAGLSVRLAVLPGGMDPDEYIAAYSAERFCREVIAAAVPATAYKLQYIRRNFQLQDVDGRFRYIDTAVKLIAALQSPVEREHYAKELSLEFSYAADTIRQQMNEARQEFLKKRDIGDNKANSWNNVMNNGRQSETAPPRMPAYYNAERMLLSVMMADKAAADYVQHKLGDCFNVEAHTALAAYLYAFYAQGHEADAVRYMATLHDHGLESAASAILNAYTYQAFNAQVIDDCIAAALKQYTKRDTINQLREQAERANRSGDALTAAKLWNEIIALEKQLKSS